MKKGTTLWWRFNGEEGWRINRVVNVKGPMVCLSWERSAWSLAPPDSVYWVRPEDIQVAHKEDP
jgi:hypothetical protein